MTEALEVAGLASITTGAFLAWLPLGPMVLGVGLLLVAWKRASS